MHVWPWEKGKVFLKNTIQTEQDNPCLWFIFYFFTSLSTRTWPLHFGDPARKCQCGDLFDFRKSRIRKRCCSWPRHLCGWLIHSCENWFAFWMKYCFDACCLSFFSFVRNYRIQEGVGDIFLSSLRRGKSKTMAAQSEVEELQLQLESKICSFDLNGLVELAAYLRSR